MKKHPEVAVVGASGYTGQELVRLLLNHDGVRLTHLVGRSDVGQRYDELFPAFSGQTDLRISDEDLLSLAKKVELIFLALPHGHACQNVTAEVLEHARVIDLGADFRLKKADLYEEWYGFVHPQAALLSQAVYGLPELNREAIIEGSLIANPGCYATCSILTLAPLLKAGLIEPDSVIVDAKSGVSGAGRGLDLAVHFIECSSSMKAYKVGSHRHTPEIEQEIFRADGEHFISFTPHLMPMARGILATVYGRLKEGVDEQIIKEAYLDAYDKERFVRLLNPQGTKYNLPETRFVKGSNFFDLGYRIDERTNRVIAVGCLDNLVKGASGQAVQNMNLLLNLPEEQGLKQLPLFPG